MFQEQMMMLLILAALVFQYSSRMGSQASNNPHEGSILTVCEVLADPLKYNGHMIRVRGAVEGTGEGIWLAGRDCKKPFITGTFLWPSVIALVYPSSASRLHNVEFDWDDESYRRVQREVRALNVDRKKQIVLVVYTGLFETRENLEFPVVTDGTGHQRQYGFGHEDAAPGQLLIKSIGGPLVIVPTSKKD